MTMNELKPIIEGLLFVVGEEGLTLETCSQVVDCDPMVVKQVMDELTLDYQAETHGFELVCYGGIYKLVSKSQLYPFIEKLFQLDQTKKLSPSALETLAIIAYKQPITRIEIEEIRGVGCDMMLRKLLAKDLIEEAGRTEAPGRPILYQVTKTFLDAFKLTDLSELPSLPSFDSDETTESDELYDK